VPAVKSLLPFFVIGITSGSVYALAGMGLVLTFKTSGLFNFAHGAQAALAAYVMFEFWERMGWPWPLAAAASLVLVGVIGGLALELVSRALTSAPLASRVAGTVGLLVAIQGALIVVFGAPALHMRFFLPTKLVRLVGVNVRVEQILVTLIAVAAAAGLHTFLTRSRLGATMQAVVDDPALLDTQGTDPVTVRRWAWIIGSCFASMSGMLLAPTIGLDSGVLTLLVFYAFGAAAVGAFSSLPMTYAGGLAIGVGASILTKFINSTGPIGALPAALPFALLFAGLLLAPKARLSVFIERPARAAPPRHRSRPLLVAGMSGGVIGMLLVPHLIGSKLPLYSTALVFVILFASLGLLVRTSGLVSLCHMTFAAVGASVFAHAAGAGLPWALAVMVGGLAAIPVGALVAVPAIRLSGIYLAVATFGLGLVVERLLFTSSLMFGRFGVRRAPRPGLSWLSTQTDMGYYHVVLLVALACCGTVIAIRRGRLGRLLRGMADAPLAVDAHGANTNLTRFWVFCLSAFLAGVAGAVAGPITGSASAASYTFGTSFLLVAVMSIAGRRPVLNAFIAAGLFVVGPGYITDQTALSYTPIIFGVAALLAGMGRGRPILERLAESKRVTDRTLADRPGRARDRPVAVGLAPAAAGEVGG
jgi:branched-subunit amino acid ABC-type transport system permease component